MLKRYVFYILLIVFSLPPNMANSKPLPSREPVIATFSIVAYDSVAEEWGVAVQSKFLAVGSVVPFAKAGIGAIATQAWGNTAYGPDGLAMLETGMPAEQVVKALTSKDTLRDNRQLGIVDSKGKSASWTGNKCSPWAGHIKGDGFCVQGNILTGEDVVKQMAETFKTTRGPLGRRLIATLYAGQKAGGDSRGKQSAAILVVKNNGGYSGYNDRFIDLRVDDHTNPIEELERIYTLHEQTFQGSAYIQFGMLALKKGDKNKANNAFDYAIALTDKYPTSVDLLNGIAWELAISNFRLDDALKLAKRAMKLMPKDGNIWDTLGEVYARLGNYAEAVKAETQATFFSKNNKDFEDKLENWKKKL